MTNSFCGDFCPQQWQHCEGPCTSFLLAQDTNSSQALPGQLGNHSHPVLEMHTPSVPPALPGTQHALTHTLRISSHHSRSGDIKDGLKLQEFPPSSWTMLRPAWYFNNLVYFFNNPHGSELRILRKTFIQCCPSTSAGGPAALPPHLLPVILM